jgi:non-specific serine/threonine protein kinase/serine/threonine-protein kinase
VSDAELQGEGRPVSDTQLERRASEIFDAVVELDASERVAYLDHVCGYDPKLRGEVESLLESLEGTRTSELFPQLLRADEPLTLAAGERIGPYTLVGEIGEGGMGVVFRATRDDVGTTVALKLVRHGRLASPEQLRRFLLERRVLGRLQHHNIARLLDAGVTDSGLPYLVMEHVDGEPIDRYCDEHRLSVEERLTLFFDVCEAVHYAHRHLVVHRDLKPFNILVTREGVVKLLDFGIAALVEDGGRGDARITRTGLAMLTPEYAAPEQVKGEPVTTASDVYSLGLLLFELLTGERPFRSEHRTTPELLRAICEEEPKAPSEVVRRLASRAGDATEASRVEAIAEARRTSPARLARRLVGDLDTIVLEALRKEPERRYCSAHELRDDIGRHLAGMPVRARADSLWYRSRKFVRRHKAVVAASALVVVSLAAGATTTTVQARRADVARAEAEQRYRDVRSLAGALVADVHDAISDLPGSLPVRNVLVRRALDHLDELYPQASDDPELQREIAAAYVELGLVQGNPTTANLGDLAAARRSFERALTIARALVAADAGDRAARRTLALAHEKLSDAEAWSGRVPEGVEHARDALEQWEYLATASPGSASAVRAVATSHIKLGDLIGNPNLPSLSDGYGATHEYREALALLRAVPGDSANEWVTRRLLALVRERIASMLKLERRHAEGIAELEKTLAIREELVRERSSSFNALRDLAVTHQLLCEARLAAGDVGGALGECRESVALYESLRAADTTNAQGMHDLALGRLSLHKALAARGELDDALSQLSLSAALLRQLLSTNADNALARRDLARSLLHSGMLHARLAARASGAEPGRIGHRERAESAYEEGSRLLLGASGRGLLSSEDSVLVSRARSELERAKKAER